MFIRTNLVMHSCCYSGMGMIMAPQGGLDMATMLQLMNPGVMPPPDGDEPPQNVPEPLPAPPVVDDAPTSMQEVLQVWNFSCYPNNLSSRMFTIFITQNLLHDLNWSVTCYVIILHKTQHECIA